MRFAEIFIKNHIFIFYRCFSGYSGNKCDQIACNQVSNCSNNGQCKDPDICECKPEFEGLFCEIPTCISLKKCSDNGVCNLNQTCSCYQGYTGNDCSIFNCSQVNVCSCFKGLFGPGCQLFAEPNLFAPEYTNKSYDVIQDEFLELNSCILSINATDLDTGRNGLVKYLIQPLYDFEYFRIDSSSGNLTLGKYLFHSLSSLLNIKVQAYDQGTPKRASTTDVRVTIKKVELATSCDDILNTSVSSYEFTTNEIAQNVTIQLKPKSLDTSRQNVTYSLKDTNIDYIKSSIRVDENTGVLYIIDSIKVGRYEISTRGSKLFSKSATHCDTNLTEFDCKAIG